MLYSTSYWLFNLTIAVHPSSLTIPSLQPSSDIHKLILQVLQLSSYPCISWFIFFLSHHPLCHCAVGSWKRQGLSVRCCVCRFKHTAQPGEGPQYMFSDSLNNLMSKSWLGCSEVPLLVHPVPGRQPQLQPWGPHQLSPVPNWSPSPRALAESSLHPSAHCSELIIPHLSD